MAPATPLPTALLDRLLEVVYLLQADLEQALARDGLTPARVPVTWHLHQHGPSTQRALAEAMGTSPRNVTGLVDGLVASGHVIRAPHPTDRRAVQVTLTDRGAGLMARMAREHVELAEELFGRRSPADLRTLAGGLDDVLEVLHRHLDGSS